MNRPLRKPERKGLKKQVPVLTQPGSESGLALELDVKNEIPLYVQLKNQLRYMIQSKRLGQGSQLPTMRQLGVDLGIDANTVARVYRELELEGLIVRQQGRGTFVSDELPSPMTDSREESALGILEGVARLMQGMNLTNVEIARILRAYAEKIEGGNNA